MRILKEKQKKELFTKKGELKNCYIKLLSYFNCYEFKKDKKIHLKSWTSSGRRFQIADTSFYNMIEFLNILDIKFETGNDAPKGGATGDYIKITSTKNNKLLKMIIDGTFPKTEKEA